LGRYASADAAAKYVGSLLRVNRYLHPAVHLAQFSTRRARSESDRSAQRTWCAERQRLDIVVVPIGELTSREAVERAQAQPGFVAPKGASAVLGLERSCVAAVPRGKT